MSSDTRAKRRQAERKLRREMAHADDQEKQPPSTVIGDQYLTANRATRRRLKKAKQW